MTIHFELIGGIIMLDVSVNGKHGQMAFDTGAMQTCLNKNYFDFSGEQKDISKFDGSVKTETAAKFNCDIKCNEWIMPNTSVMIVDMDYVEKPLKGVKANLIFLGTIGIDMIRSHKVLIDYTTSHIILNADEIKNSETFKMAAEVLPIIDVCIEDEHYNFVLDTGANTCMLDESFKNKGFKELNETANIVQIPQLVALGHRYNDIAAVYADMTAIKSKVDVSGIIGYQVLKECISYFDFDSETISVSLNN